MKYHSTPEVTMAKDEYCLLIHRLLQDRERLEQMVIQAREEVNSMAAPGTDPIYDLTAEDVFDRSYSDMTALSEYEEMFGKEALTD